MTQKIHMAFRTIKQKFCRFMVGLNRIPILISVCLFSSLFTEAQISAYSFSSFTQSYQELSAGITLGDSSSEDEFFIDPALPAGGTQTSGPGLPIGFNFNYNGTQMNVFGVSTNGWIELGQNSVNMNSASLFFPLSSVTGSNFIAACARNLQAQSGSSLKYSTDGLAPNRILTIEWKNFRKHSNIGDSFNFQIQLHEQDSSIEFHYGNFIHNLNASFVSVGLTGQDSSDFNVRSTNGSGGWSNTNTGTLNSATCTLNPSVLPSSGLVFHWTAPAPCTSPPIPGSTLSSAIAVCPNTPFLLSLNGNSSGPGQTYQWQSSVDSINWNNISLAQSTSLSITQTQAHWYRCEISCSGLSSYSAAVLVEFNPANLCYCTQNLGGQCSSYGYIDSVQILSTSLRNFSTGCAALTDLYYSDYPVSANTTATLEPGVSYAISVTCSFNASISMWIDYDQSGTFDATEWTQISASSPANVAAMSLFTIPANAPEGTTKMRIRSRSAGSPNGAIDACTNFLSGETEDYTLSILTPVGLKKNELSSKQFVIYPNPASNSIKLVFGELRGDGRISISDLSGKLVLSTNIKHVSESDLKLEGISEGVYLISLDDSSGRSYQRLVISR